MGRPSAIGTDALGARTGARRAVLFVAAVCLIAAAVAWLPGLDSLRARFRAADPRWIAVAMALQLASVLSFVAALRGAFERRVSWRPAFDLAVIEQGANDRAFHAGVPLALAPLGLADVRRLLRRAPPPDELAKQFEPTTLPCPSTS